MWVFGGHGSRASAVQEPARRRPIEADETFVGGKLRPLSKQALEAGVTRRRGLTAEAGANKTPVLAIIRRDGEARAHVPTDVTRDTLGKHIREAVDTARSRLHTDEWASYVPVGRELTTNTAESFFAILKWGIYGVFHSASKKHLHRYGSEFEFRWNTRKLSDGQRVMRAIRGAEGKRLMYRHP